MKKMIVGGLAFGLASFVLAGAAFADAKPTIHADDIVKALSAPGAAAPQPPPQPASHGACNRNAWVTDEDGTLVHPKCSTMGFNLGAASNDTGGAAANNTGARAPKGRRAPRIMASTPVAPAVAPSVDMLLTFNLGSAELTPEGLANAQQFAIAVKDPKLAGYSFRVEGYTDKAGSYAYNVALSQRRADATKAYLVSLGVEESRLVTKGFGPVLVRPEAPFDEANRRVVARRVTQ
jgi:outer membrane protein OmpA-like peptidoglycan-associated protein